MVHECNCGAEISEGRAKILFADAKPLTCLSCGENEAQEEINRKRKRIMPANNKGAIMYIEGDTLERQKRNVLGRTGKGIFEDEK